MGSTRLGVKQKVQSYSLVGGGLRGARWGLGTHWVGWKTTTKWWWWWWSAETEQIAALQLTLGGCGAHLKNPKNITIVGF